MVSHKFSAQRIHGIACLSCCTWVLINCLAHLVTRTCWRGYKALPRRKQLAWCNRIASILHAAVLAGGQARNLWDPALRADPLLAVTDGHFFWGSIMYGYLVYDTACTVVFYRIVGSPAFLLHHILGLTSCWFGLYQNRLAFFGMVIQVFFEGTTPLLHALACLRVLGLKHTCLYLVTGMVFTVQFFCFRVVVANYYWWVMIVAVKQHFREAIPGWAWAGIAVYGLLCQLNIYWFCKLISVAAGTLSSAAQQPPGLESVGTHAAQVAHREPVGSKALDGSVTKDAKAVENSAEAMNNAAGLHEQVMHTEELIKARCWNRRDAQPAARGLGELIAAPGLTNGVMRFDIAADCRSMPNRFNFNMKQD